MKQLADYSQLKVDDVVHIQPTTIYKAHILNYYNINNTKYEDWSILGIVKEIKSLRGQWGKLHYAIKIAPMSSNFGLMTQYDIVIDSHPSSVLHVIPRDIQIISED